MVGIALTVAIKFRTPVIAIAFGPPAIKAARIVMAMPEASMNEDNFSPRAKNQIRFAW